MNWLPFGHSVGFNLGLDLLGILSRGSVLPPGNQLCNAKYEIKKNSAKIIFALSIAILLK